MENPEPYFSSEEIVDIGTTFHGTDITITEIHTYQRLVFEAVLFSREHFKVLSLSHHL